MKSQAGAQPVNTVTTAEFQRYASFVKQHFGIQLPPEKKTLLESRLYTLCNNNQGAEFASASSFLQYLENDRSGKAQKLFADAITTNHTFFMRESDHFDYYRDVALPYWGNKIKDGDVRTWCAASSTGEEPYTLMMIMQDFFNNKAGVWDKTLLATDLSQEALDKAKLGMYPEGSIQAMPPHFQKAYFQRVAGGMVQVVPTIRQQILYRRFNLMEEHFPFKKPFHVIFCRNVMIYFDEPTRRRLAQKFYDFLEPGGFLFIGHSEVIDRAATPFSYVMPSVYRRM